MSAPKVDLTKPFHHDNDAPRLWDGEQRRGQRWLIAGFGPVSVTTISHFSVRSGPAHLYLARLHRVHNLIKRTFEQIKDLRGRDALFRGGEGDGKTWGGKDKESTLCFRLLRIGWIRGIGEVMLSPGHALVVVRKPGVSRSAVREWVKPTLVNRRASARLANRHRCSGGRTFLSDLVKWPAFRCRLV